MQTSLEALARHKERVASQVVKNLGYASPATVLYQVRIANAHLGCAMLSMSNCNMKISLGSRM